MLSRFERDALSKPGVRWILMLSGSNDISAADMLDTPKDKVSAQQIIAGMQKLIARAHAKVSRSTAPRCYRRRGSENPSSTLRKLKPSARK